jgi:hypothetical protein
MHGPLTRIVAALVAVAALSMIAVGCADSEDGASPSSTTAAPAADPDAAATDPLPDVPAEELAPFCEQFNELQAAFSDPNATEFDTDGFVAGLQELAAAAPSAIADDAELFSNETTEVVARAEAEGVPLNEVPDDWYSEDFATASSNVFRLGYDRCVEFPTPSTPAG